MKSITFAAICVFMLFSAPLSSVAFEKEITLPQEGQTSTEPYLDGGDVFEGCGRLHGFFSVTELYKSNLYRTAEDPEGTWATYVTPGIWAAIPGSCNRIIEIVTSNGTPGGLAVSDFYPETERKYQGYLFYTPQYEMYSLDSDINMLTHRTDLYYRYNSRNQFSFRTLDQFKRTHDSQSRGSTNIDDQYNSNLFSTLATFDPTKKTRLRLDYSNYYLNYDSDDNEQSNRMDNTWAAYGYFDVSAKTSIFANYEFIDISYDVNELDSYENRFWGGFRWDITHKTSGQIKGGYGDRNYEQSALSSADTWMAEAQLDHTLTSRTRVILNAYRKYDEPVGEIVDQENFTKYILSHLIGLTVNHDYNTKMHLYLDIQLFYDEYNDEKSSSTREERQDTEFSISPAIKFDVRKWLTFDLAYIYTNRHSNDSEFDVQDHTALLRASVYQ